MARLPPSIRGSAVLPSGLASEVGCRGALQLAHFGKAAGDEAGLLLSDPQRVVDVIDHMGQRHCDDEIENAGQKQWREVSGDHRRS